MSCKHDGSRRLEAGPGRTLAAERSVDLLLGRSPTPLCEEDLHAEVLFDDRIHIVVGLQSRWARRRKIALAELIGEPWALPAPDSLPGSMIAAAFSACGLNMPRATVVTSSIHLLGAGLPATGRFLTVLPASVLRFGAKRLARGVGRVADLARQHPGAAERAGQHRHEVSQRRLRHRVECADRAAGGAADRNGVRYSGLPSGCRKPPRGAM
jgi:DNA-binding transcriptional LysR family regulator